MKLIPVKKLVTLWLDNLTGELNTMSRIGNKVITLPAGVGSNKQR